MTAQQLKNYILENQIEFWSQSCIAVNNGKLSLVSARVNQSTLPENWVFIGECLFESGNFNEDELEDRSKELRSIKDLY